MSDFLANFDKNNYKDTVTEKKAKGKQADDGADVELKASNKKRSSPKKRVRELDTNNHEGESTDKFSAEDPSKAISDKQLVANKGETELDPIDKGLYKVDEEEHSAEEETEIDPTYKKRQQKKIIIFSVLGLISAIILFWLYYSMTHVALPKFTGKPISEARAWASENNVKLDVEQKYDFDKEVNTIVKQGTKVGKKVKKKSTVKLVASLGPDPEELLAFPDFSKLSKSAADEWVAEHKAENLSVLEEYSDTVEKGKFIRQEFNNKELTPETYKREDQAVVYYSKGKEVFEKNVAVPDFDKKTKADVEAWVKTNEIKMEYKTVDSDKVEEGMIVSQSIAKGTKIAKRDSMSVEVSTGKAITVPNFGDLTPETATTVQGLTVTVKTVLAWDIPYGNLISQSIAAGEKVKEKEGKTITVTYSAGKPYLKSYFGQLEGDLEKLFFEDYRSKGANIKFTTYYVDSAEERGKVVDMSAYNQYVPLDFTVSIGISNGSRAGKPTESPTGRSGTTDNGAGNKGANDGNNGADDGNAGQEPE